MALASAPQGRPPMAPTAADQIAMAAKYGPNTGLAMQRSQYLAQALANMQQHGGEDIRTPAALGANLLATALLSWGKSRADKETLADYQAENDAYNKRLVSGLPGVGDASSSSASASAPSTEARPLQVGGAVSNFAYPDDAAPDPLGKPTGGSALADALAPSRPVDQIDPATLHLAQMVWGEARGEPPEGQQAVAAVALNRAKQSGKPLDEVLAAPGQFSGYNARSQAVPADQLASVLANIQPALNGQDPTNGADHFYNPALANPSWGAGPGQTIGHHKFMALNGPIPRQADGQLALPPGVQFGGGNPQGNPAPPQLPGGGSLSYVPPGPGGVQPYQIAANGPTPPPPAAAGPGQPQNPGPVPTSPQGPPHQYVDPAQVRALLPFLNDPRTQDWARQQLLELRMRQATPLEAPKDMQWNPQSGRYEPLPGTTYAQLPGASPSDAAQASPFGEVKHSKIEGVQGEVPPGMRYDQQRGGYVPIAGGQARPLTDPAERLRLGIQPSDRNAYMIKPNGDIVTGAPDPFGPKDQLAYTAQVVGLEPYKNYTLGRGYLSTMQTLMKQPGGFADLGLIENAGKTINPTIAIRPNMIEQYGKEVGWPDWLVGEVSSVMNHGGHLTEQGRNALLNIAQANVASHWEQLQPILKKVDHDAARYGVSREDLLPDLVPMPSTPPAPYPGARIPGASQPGSAASPADVIQQARAAIAQGKDRDAVIKRVRDMGIDPRGL